MDNVLAIKFHHVNNCTIFRKSLTIKLTIFSCQLTQTNYITNNL